MICRECPSELGPRNKSGLCRSCSCARMGRLRTKPRKVCGCGKVLSHRNKTGQCHPCFNTSINNDPEIKRKRAEGIRRKFKDPMHRAKMVVVARRNGKAASNDPAHRQWLRENGRRIYNEYLNRPDIRAKNAIAVSAAKDKVWQKRMGWCPPEMLDRYRYLIRTKRMLAADARAKVLAEHKQKVAELSPFERQMRALEKGAKLIANDTKPSLTNPGNFGERKWG